MGNPPRILVSDLLVGIEAADRLRLRRVTHPPRRDVPIPDADRGGFGRELKARLALLQGDNGSFLLGYVLLNAQPVGPALQFDGGNAGGGDEGRAVLASVQPLAPPRPGALQRGGDFVDDAGIVVGWEGVLHRYVLADEFADRVAE